MNNKKHLKDLIAQGKIDQAFKILEAALPVSSPEKNILITNKLKLDKVEESRRMGAIAEDAYNVISAQVVGALLSIVDALPDEEIRAATGKPLQDYHRFTCDRVDQSDLFYTHFEPNIQRKKHYFYIYGVEQHAHEGLFKRFAFDLEGKLQDYLSNTVAESSCQTLKLSITFDESRSAEGYKRNVLKSLFGALSVAVDEQSPLLDKRLTDLVANSPQIKGLGPEDYVCIFLSISEYDWDAEITPLIVRWFITTFCEVELPDNAPTFLFFFGLIYEEDDGDIEAEVQQAIQEGQHIKPLPKLNMVSQRDLKKWLAKYKNKLELSTEERKAIIAGYFENKDEFYMEKVERILAKIIVEHNKKFYT